MSNPSAMFELVNVHMHAAFYITPAAKPGRASEFVLWRSEPNYVVASAFSEPD